MKTLLTLAVALFMALALAPAAAAKSEIRRATLWGASGSVSTDDPEDLRALPTAGAYAIDAPPLAPFYTLDVTVDEGGPDRAFLAFYVPSAQRIAVLGPEGGGLEWYPVSGSGTLRVLGELAARVDPYPRQDRWPMSVKTIDRFQDLARADVPGAAAAAPRAEAEGTRAKAWKGAAVGAAGLASLFALTLVARRRGRARSPLREHA